jgi:hypothetical protein
MMLLVYVGASPCRVLRRTQACQGAREVGIHRPQIHQPPPERLGLWWQHHDRCLVERRRRLSRKKLGFDNKVLLFLEWCTSIGIKPSLERKKANQHKRDFFCLTSHCATTRFLANWPHFQLAVLKLRDQTLASALWGNSPYLREMWTNYSGCSVDHPTCLSECQFAGFILVLFHPQLALLHCIQSCFSKFCCLCPVFLFHHSCSFTCQFCGVQVLMRKCGAPVSSYFQGTSWILLGKFTFSPGVLMIYKNSDILTK